MGPGECHRIGSERVARSPRERSDREARARSAKREARGSEATENASAKRDARGSEATLGVGKVALRRSLCSLRAKNESKG